MPGWANKLRICDRRLKTRNEVDKNLTATDLLTVACGADYLATHGALLCREMFCRLQTNGAGSLRNPSAKKSQTLQIVWPHLRRAPNMGIMINV